MKYHMVAISPKNPPLAVWCGWPKKGLETTCEFYRGTLSEKNKAAGYGYEVVRHEDCHHAGFQAAHA